MYTTLDWVALGIWIVVILVIIYGIVAIHDIPASVARKRHHPHMDAIEAAGWVSLFMLHVLWPFLWIWAFYYKPEIEAAKIDDLKDHDELMKTMQKRLSVLEARDAESTPTDSMLNMASAPQNSEGEA